MERGKRSEKDGFFSLDRESPTVTISSCSRIDVSRQVFRCLIKGLEDYRGGGTTRGESKS